MNHNYSYATSLPAYKSYPDSKELQRYKVLDAINSGGDNLLKISEMTGIEQSKVSARMSDLIKENKATYHEQEYVYYRNHKRKKIVPVKPEPINQPELFN